jgi:hypothetical protein
MAGANKNQKKAAKAVASGRGSAAARETGAKYIIPLNFGKHAYLSVDGKTHHVATDSAKFDELVAELAGKNAARLQGELDELAEQYPASAWPTVRDRVAANLAGAGAASA